MICRGIFPALIILFLHSAYCQSTEDNCAAKEEEPWSYVGKNGPSFWGNTFEKCNGSGQSPIDIQVQNTTSNNTASGRIRTFGFMRSLRGTIKNDGHTIKVTSGDGIERGFEFGGTRYMFLQLHIHYGTLKDNGSEHTVNGERYAMELHMVHKSANNETAVIGVIFEESRRMNRHLLPIMRALDGVMYSGESTSISRLWLARLLPSCERPVYFHYEGSLTVPECEEGVLWFVMNGRSNISARQLFLLRRLNSTTRSQGTCPLAGNVREVQELNDRVVTSYTGDCPSIR